MAGSVKLPRSIVRSSERQEWAVSERGGGVLESI